MRGDCAEPLRIVPENMASPRLPNRRSRRPLALAVAAGLILVAWVGCHNGSRDAGALTSAGVTHLQMRQYERALADFEQAILLAPSDARLYTDRAVAYELLGDYPSAIRDFNRAIAFKPNHASAIEGRGRTYFYLGNFAQAASDLQRGLALDSADSYGGLWLHLARQRLRQDDSEDFAAHAAAVDSTRWPAPILRYMLGEVHADSLRALAAAAELDGQTQRCVVSFYLGEVALLKGEAASAASLFDETRTTCPKELNEHRAAVAELQRMARSTVPAGQPGSTTAISTR